MIKIEKPRIEQLLDYIYGTASESPAVSILLEGTELAEYWRMEDLAEAIKDRIIESLSPETLDESELFAQQLCL